MTIFLYHHVVLRFLAINMCIEYGELRDVT